MLEAEAGYRAITSVLDVSVVGAAHRHRVQGSYAAARQKSTPCAGAGLTLHWGPSAERSPSTPGHHHLNMCQSAVPPSLSKACKATRIQ